jgi:hypothetical protein
VVAGKDWDGGGSGNRRLELNRSFDGCVLHAVLASSLSWHRNILHLKAKITEADITTRFIFYPVVWVEEPAAEAA